MKGERGPKTMQVRQGRKEGPRIENAGSEHLEWDDPTRLLLEFVLCFVFSIRKGRTVFRQKSGNCFRNNELPGLVYLGGMGWFPGLIPTNRI